MARDLYGEMLSRALNRGAPQGHFAAYINPGEAAQLRAQGGGVSPGGGQYVANGLPSYQSTADWEAYAAMAEALGSSVEMPSAPTPDDLPPVAAASSAFDEERNAVALALDQAAVPLSQTADAQAAAPPPPAARIGGGRQMAMGLGYGQGSPEYAMGGYGGPVPLGMPLGPPTGEPAFVFIERREKDAAQAVEDAQSQNAAETVKRNDATAKMIEENPWLTGEELEMAKIAVMQQYKQPVPNDELSELNLNYIFAIPNLSGEKRSELLSKNISEGGIGGKSPGAGAFARGVDKKYWKGVPIEDQKAFVREQNRSHPGGGYAISHPESINLLNPPSVPRELAPWPAKAAQFIAPLLAPGIGLPMSLSRGSNLWNALKRNFTGSSNGDEEPLNVASANQHDFSPTIPSGVLEGPQPSVTEPTDLTEPFVSKPVPERPLDPISDAMRMRLEEHKRAALERLLAVPSSQLSSQLLHPLA